MSETETTPTNYTPNIKGSRTTPAVPFSTSKESSKLIVELTNLSEGSLRTVKRELKVLIEDYAWKKMISGSIRVTEGE